MPSWHGLPTIDMPAGNLPQKYRKVGPIESHLPVPKKKMMHTGMTAALRELRKGQSRWLPTQMSNAHTLATRALGKGNFVARTENGGSRVWRKE